MREPLPFLAGGERRRSDEIATVTSPVPDLAGPRVCLAGPDDARDAIERAAAAAPAIRRMPAHERSGILSRLAGLLEEHREELARLILTECGKLRALAVAEVDRSVATVTAAAEEARRMGGEVIPLDWSPAGEGRVGILRRVPVGVVFGITPFNFPLNLACHKLAPAFAAGNAVIIRPSRQTPATALKLGELALEAGVPPEGLSVLPCAPPVAEMLVRDPRIGFLSFTGSAEVGWRLHSLAGRTRCGLEHGGNAAVIVHGDADIAHAAARIVDGAFANAGQVCISVQRVFLHRSVFDEGLAGIADRAGALVTGDPRDPATDVGPMISADAADRAWRAVAAAVDAGARLHTGGPPDGAFFSPAVLSDTTPEMAVNATEIFAPVVTVTPYDTFEEALRMANDTPYGLQMGVFSRDVRLIWRAFEGAETGGVVAGDIPTVRLDHMPYGGVKGSGMGREGPRYAMEEMTEARLLVLTREGGAPGE
ncbi:MAG: aldehyde dehydrogenase family protein [Methanomicrobiales archaeon]